VFSHHLIVASCCRSRHASSHRQLFRFDRSAERVCSRVRSHRGRMQRNRGYLQPFPTKSINERIRVVQCVLILESCSETGKEIGEARGAWSRAKSNRARRTYEDLTDLPSFRASNFPHCGGRSGGRSVNGDHRGAVRMTTLITGTPDNDTGWRYSASLAPRCLRF